MDMEIALEAEERFVREPDSAYCKDLARGLGVEALEEMGDAEELRNEDEAEGEDEADEADESTEIDNELASMPESVEFFRSNDLIRG